MSYLAVSSDRHRQPGSARMDVMKYQSLGHHNPQLILPSSKAGHSDLRLGWRLPWKLYFIPWTRSSSRTPTDGHGHGAKPSTQHAVSLSLCSTQPPAHLPPNSIIIPLPLSGSLPNFLTSISHSAFSPTQLVYTSECSTSPLGQSPSLPPTCFRPSDLTPPSLFPPHTPTSGTAGRCGTKFLTVILNPRTLTSLLHPDVTGRTNLNK